ncbi:MAG: PAS domain S-box protein [Methanoregula sp.]
MESVIIVILALYVDDEPALLDIGKEFLERSGSILIDTVSSAAEAQQRLSANCYDAIVSDYQMPGMNGIEFLKYVRQTYPGLPFILFTGKGREEVVIDALNNGADFYLQKGGRAVPQFAELEHKIKQAVQQKRNERTIAESEERYRALFENANDAIFLMDRDIYIDCNWKAAELFGCTRDELIGTSVDAHSPRFQPDGSESGVKARTLVSQALRGEPGIFDWRHQRPGGEEFEVEVSLTRLSVNGRDHLLAILRDAGERKQVESALRESAGLMTGIIDFLPDATFAVNSDGRVIAWNRSMEDLTGVSAREIIGKGDYEYSVPLYGERRPILIDLICSHDTATASKYDSIEVIGSQMVAERFFPNLNGGNGAHLWFKASPLLDSHGKIIGAIESIRDITAHKTREIELRATYEQVAAMEEELRNNFEELAAREKAVSLSESKFRSLFATMIEGSALGEILTDDTGNPADYRILEVNPAFERIFGITRNSATGRTSREVFGTDSQEALRLYARVASTGIPQSFETFYPPMKKHFAISVYSPKKGQFATVFDDITLRKQNEQALREAYEQIAVVEEELRSSFEELSHREQALRASREQYRRIVETANEGIWALDSGFVTTFANQKLAEMLNYPAEEIVGHPITEFMAQEDLPDHDLRVQARHSGKSERYERRLIRKGGGEVWCIISGTPVFDSAGAFQGSFAMLTDITARKTVELGLAEKVTELNVANEEMVMTLEELRSAEETLVARNRELEEQQKVLAATGESLSLANRKLNLLSSVTRHDVLNLLMVLNGYIELSKYSHGGEVENLAEKQLGVINRIHQQILFTREYQNLGIQAPHWQEIRTVFRNSVAGLDFSGIRVEMNIPEVEVYADPLLPKAFYNILDNAMRYGEKATRIAVSCQPGMKGLVIAVEDNGVGINPSDKAFIFNKGFGKNTGFGLFLTAEILQMTGLSITETGTPGAGARFEVLVPEGAYRFRAQ